MKQNCLPLLINKYSPAKSVGLVKSKLTTLDHKCTVLSTLNYHQDRYVIFIRQLIGFYELVITSYLAP